MNSGLSKIMSIVVANINASSLMSRLDELEALHNKMAALAVRQTLFRLSGPALKHVGKWSVPWGAREDAMLLVGVYRYKHFSYVCSDSFDPSI
jgi:hypothetical protein